MRAKVNLESLVKLISEPTPAGITRWERKKEKKSEGRRIKMGTRKR